MKFRMYVFILIMLSVSLLAAQEIDWNITGAGARAAGFGGAFIGVADDATAIVWNPAGLTQLAKPEASVVVKSVAEEFKTEIPSLGSSTETQTHAGLNFLSVATPVSTSKIVGAIAWQQQIDGYYKQGTQERTGGINAISIGAALPIGKVLSFGLAGNVWTGKMKMTETDTETDDTVEASSKFSGLNFVIGVMASFSTPLKLGLTIRTPFDLKEKYTQSIPSYTSNSKVQMPMMVGMGASYRFGEALTVALDYENRQYSKSKVVDTDTDAEFELSKYDLNQIRIGAEYLILGPGFRIPVRLGIQSVPTTYSNQVVDNFDNFVDDDQVIGSGFGIGTGLITDRFSLDLTISGKSYEQKYDDLFKIIYTNASIFLSGIIYF